MKWFKDSLRYALILPFDDDDDAHDNYCCSSLEGSLKEYTILGFLHLKRFALKYYYKNYLVLFLAPHTLTKT